MAVTKIRILADKALQETAGQQCVDWAIGMLQRGHDGHNLLQLAGILPPYNHFEISSLRDHALEELGVSDPSADEAVRAYASEVLKDGLAGNISLAKAIEIVSSLHVGNNYQRELGEFYHLYYARQDLEHADFQFYWPSATRDNIDDIIRERATAFVSHLPN